MFAKRVLKAVFLVCLVMAGSCTLAQEPMRTCPGLDVRFVQVTFEIPKTRLADAHPRVLVAPAGTTSRGPEALGERAVKVTALGPILGSMDSRDVGVSLACTATGFALTAVITRSADYNGAVLANLIWRPLIDVDIVVRRPEVTVDVKWTMRLSTGTILNRAQTAPYPEQHYPLTMTTSIH